MTSWISKALEKLRINNKCKALIMGIDASGKTTLLYRIKLGELVKTISTIGFIVENVEYRNLSFCAWDLGGSPLIKPMFRDCYENTQIIIFVIDSNDRERLDKSWYFSVKEYVMTLLTETELKAAMFLIYANKQDLPNAMSVEEITKRLKLEEIMKNRTWHIQPCCAKTGEGLYEGLDWIVDHYQDHRKNASKLQADLELMRKNKLKSILLISGYVRNFDMKFVFINGMKIPSVITKLIHWFYQDPNLKFDADYKYYGEYGIKNDHILSEIDVDEPDLLMQFIQRKENDEDYIHNDDEFIQQIESKGIEFMKSEVKWVPHYDFMRMIWIFFVQNGRRDGMKLIWKYTPYNVTRTYFWCQIIYFAMNNTFNEETKKLLHSDFQYILIMNPCLTNNYAGLIKEYYSQSLLNMIDNEKKDEMVLPDLQKLPSVMTDIEKLKKQKEPGNDGQYKVNHETDSDDGLFIQSFEQRTYKSWEGHRSFLRIIWCYADQMDGGKGFVKKIREQWKLFKKDAYHETLMYFWVHMVRYWRAIYKEYFNDDQNEDKHDGKWNFKSFIEFCQRNEKQCEILDENWWKQYYDEKIVIVAGKTEMILPTKQHLPQLRIVAKQTK